MTKLPSYIEIRRGDNGGFVVSGPASSFEYFTPLAGLSNAADLLAWLAEQLQDEPPAPAGRPVFVPNETSRPVLAAVERYTSRGSPEGGSL